jgi:hypothetical protein
MTEDANPEPADNRDRFPEAANREDQGPDAPREVTDPEPIPPLPGAAQGNPGAGSPGERRGEIPAGPPDPTVGPD